MPTLCDSSNGNNLDIIVPGIDVSDGCEVLGKAKVFIAMQGVLSTLRWVFRDSQGNPIDLSACFPADSASASSSATDVEHVVQVRWDKALKICSTPPIIFYGVVVDAANGVVQAHLPAAAVAKAGVFQMHWAIGTPITGTGIPKDVIAPLYVNRALVSVERSLFGSDFGISGPPTIQDIRLHIKDSSPAENFLLDDVEFDDAEIIRAIVKPVEQWNETNPMMAAHRYDTQTFPFRHFWLQAIQGYLLLFASHHYRRNRLPYSSAGVSVDDLNKEQQYLAASDLLLKDWSTWMIRKKGELNALAAYGIVGSDYD